MVWCTRHVQPGLTPPFDTRLLTSSLIFYIFRQRLFSLPPFSWEDYFMAVAFLSAQRSKDPSSQIGACIVNQDKKIVGIGYNGEECNCVRWSSGVHMARTGGRYQKPTEASTIGSVD